MNRMPLDSGNRIMLNLAMTKVLERFARRTDDMSNITFRVDLIELQKRVEQILQEYEEKTRGKY